MRTRDEQIDSLYYGHNRYSTITQDAFRNHLIEAERRAEERVRAEIARDSERLDWISRTPEFFFELLQDQPGDGDIMVIAGDMVFTGSTFRNAIDAAREVG